MSGAIAKTVCAPIERVKLLMQTQHTNPAMKDRPYKSVLECFQRTINEEGGLSLWRGNTANVIRYFPTTALNFAIKDKVNSVFNPYKAKENPYKFFIGNVMAGGIAGSCSMIVVYPLDFARTRLGTDTGNKHNRSFNGIGDVIKKIIASDGVAGLYRGFGISVTGIFIYRALYFGMYDSGK